MLCLAFGTTGITYAGTLSGDIYKWERNNLIGTIQGHEVFFVIFESKSKKNFWGGEDNFFLGGGQCTPSHPVAMCLAEVTSCCL